MAMVVVGHISTSYTTLSTSYRLILPEAVCVAVAGKKKLICKFVIAHRKLFLRISGSTKQALTISQSNLASVASYWCSRRKISIG